MSFFGPVSSIVSKGFDWGMSSVAQGWKVTKDLGTTVINTSASAYATAQTYAADTASAGVEWTKEAVVAKQTSVAQSTVRALLRDPQQRDRIVSTVDKRARFSSVLVQPCPNGNTTHPDKRDGSYMGKDCPNTQLTRPAEGTKPENCQCDKKGNAFPKIIFSNGINNTAEVVCKTMHAIADSRCAEVIGVFNATYADRSLKSPEHKLSDYKGAALEAYKGAKEGFSNPEILGTLRGAAKGGLAEAAMQFVSHNGVVQDVIDCITTINRSTTEAATETLSQEIVESIRNKKTAKMTIYLHSQGGLNGASAIEHAKGKLIKTELQSLRRQGVNEDEAKKLASASAEESLSKLEVYTFGTLERGLPDGPQYHRFTNELDPIPKVINEAQKSYVPNLITNEPDGAEPVTRFSAAPSLSAIDAHGMQESYIPWLDKHMPKKPCC